MYGVRVAFGKRQGVVAIAGFQYNVAGALQDRMNQLANDFVILDYKNGFGSERWLRQRGMANHIRTLPHLRQVDLKRAAFAKFAVHPNIATTLLHKAVYH